MIHEYYSCHTIAGEYRAMISQFSKNDVRLDVFFTDSKGIKHHEFCRYYRSIQSARNRLKNYVNGETYGFVKLKEKEGEVCGNVDSMRSAFQDNPEA